MNVLSGLAIFLLGASAGSILRYFHDRKLLQMYRQETQQSIQALLEVMAAYEEQTGKKSSVMVPGREPSSNVESGSLRSA